MIKININGNRSDIIGYVSYYSVEELANLLNIEQEEIIYETAIVDYFLHGDITFESEVIVKVTITDNYIEKMQEITNILVKYVSFFTNKCKVYYEIIDSRLLYVYENKNKKKEVNEEDHKCSCEHCDCDDECHCEDCDCKDGECDCGDECHCHEHNNHHCDCKHKEDK